MSAWSKIGGLFKKGEKYIKENPEVVEEVVKNGTKIYNDVKKKKAKNTKKK